MTIDEMRKHEWSVSWSGGKDSTATVILCHEYGIPISDITYVRMMFDETTPATLPSMTEFVDHASEVFKSWGYKVKIVPSIKTAKSLTEKIYHNSKCSSKNGKQYGISAFMRGMCTFNGVKVKTIKSVTTSDYEMIGYASDETERLHRLKGNKCSIMVELGITEQQAIHICTDYELLAPLYFEGSTMRDGCWFCPNCSKRKRERIKAEHPSLYQHIIDMIHATEEWQDQNKIDQLSLRNHWLADYEAEKARKAQFTFFDGNFEFERVE